MFGIVGLLGIMGCIIAVGVGAAVAVVGSIVAGGISLHNAAEAEESQEKTRTLAQENQKKNEAAQAAAHLRQKRQIAKNLQATAGSLGSGIMYERLLTERGKRTLVKERAEMKNNADGNLPRPSTHMKGNPAAQA